MKRKKNRFSSRREKANIFYITKKKKNTTTYGGGGGLVNRAGFISEGLRWEGGRKKKPPREKKAASKILRVVPRESLTPERKIKITSGKRKGDFKEFWKLGMLKKKRASSSSGTKG